MQLAFCSEADRRKTQIVVKCLVSDLGHGIGNCDPDQIGTTRKCAVADADEAIGQTNLAQLAFFCKGFCANGGNGFSVNGVGNRDVAAVTRIGADFHRPVVQLYVDVGDPVLLVHPIGVKRQVCCEFIFVPVVFFGTLRIVIPTVEHGVQTFRLGNVLQRMIANKELLSVV